jgi:hypothetical protein
MPYPTDHPLDGRSAPDMLAALIAAERALTLFAPPAYDPALAAVRTAIAQAEGRT